MTPIARKHDSAQAKQSIDRRSHWLELAPLLEGCSQHLRTLLRACAESLQLSERHLLILWLCAADPQGSSQIELAQQLSISPAQLSQLLEQLRRRGLLESTRDPLDRRRQRSRLTGRGEQAWAQLEADLDRKLGDLEPLLPSYQLRAVRDSLARLVMPCEPHGLKVVADSEPLASTAEENHA